MTTLTSPELYDPFALKIAYFKNQNEINNFERINWGEWRDNFLETIIVTELAKKW
jgi:hypothetical protein